MTEAELSALIGQYGLMVLTPLAVLEGPVISVVTGYLARIGMIGLPKALALLVLADLAGDLMLYTLGRGGRAAIALSWLRVFGLTRRRLARMLRRFRAQGGRILVLGKLTHGAGFAVLLAAGMVPMPLPRFMALNLLATLPKSAALLGIGWCFGAVVPRTGDWIALAGGGVLALCLALIAIRIAKHGRLTP